MIFWKIFKYEFGYHAGRLHTWLYVAVLFTFTIGMKLLIATGDGVYPNNTLHITGMTVIGGLMWVLIGASVAGEAAARDVQLRMHPLIYTSPVKKLNYLGGRFLAAFAANAIIVLALPLGVLLSFYLPGMEQEELLPFRPIAYLNVYFLIALPTVFVATALQFTIAALSRQVMASYMASLLLAIFPQLVAVSLANLFGNWDLIKLLDPVGIGGILNSELATWTASEKNTRLISLEGMFLFNRLLWLGVAAGLLVYTYHRFNFTNPVTKSWFNKLKRKSKVQAETIAENGIIRTNFISVTQVPRSFGFKMYSHQMCSIARKSFKTIAGNPLGLTLVGAIALVSAAFGDLIINAMGIPLVPTTQQVIAYLSVPVSTTGSPWVIIPLLIMYFAGELIWRERDAGLSEMADATPAPDWVLFTGKFLGLALIIAVWMAILMIGGILMQWQLGYDTPEIGIYLKVLFGLQLTEYLLFTLLVFVIHILVNQKFIGYLVVLLVFSFMAFPSEFGMEHPMLIYGAGPGWWYTDMRGFGTSLEPWLWFKAYWIGWAVLLAVAAKLLWPRGKEQDFTYRIQAASGRFKGPTIWVSIVGFGLLLSLGSFLFYNTNMLNEYSSQSDIIEAKAAYEHRYGQFRNTPQPQLTATKLQVELYPTRQQAKIRATYTLVNKDSVAIDSIHMGNVSGPAFWEVKFDRPAASVVMDKELNHYIYSLEQALMPGDSLQLSFSINYRKKGFEHSVSKALVVENGTYFTNFDLLPSLGYQRSREINDAVLRKKHQLPARPELPSLYDPEAHKKPLSTEQTTLEITIGTAANEVAIAPGALQRSWEENKRRYFHYKTDGPIGGEYSILSAAYAFRKIQWNDVAISIYHHPKHAQNIEKMLHSAKTSLEYYTAQFGPYPFGYLTLVEGAGNGGGATADAGIIYYGEQYAIMQPDDSPTGFDLPYYIMAHEVAHQWWGIARLEPAFVEGAGVLIEGLSVYSGMQVLEKTYGEGHLQEYVNFLHSAYALPRSLASASLLRANEPFLYYKKGGLALYSLSKYIGKEKVNFALRSLLQKHESGEVSLPTTLDLYKELQQITPDSLNYLLQDLFEKNTYWRIKTKEFTAAQTKAGHWEVTLKVEAQKFLVDNSGAEKEEPMKDWLEIGIFEEGKGLSEPLYLKMHQIRSGEQTIQVTVPRKPGWAGIDPNKLMIDVRLEDNMMQLDQ